MANKNYIDPHALANHAEDAIIETIKDILYSQIPVITENKWHDSDEDEIVNQAFGYLITKLYKQETNNYDK